MNATPNPALSVAVPASYRYRVLEGQYLPGAYQDLSGWIALIAALACIANILGLSTLHPLVLVAIPLVVVVELAHWLLGRYQIELPRTRGIVNLEDLACAILEQRRASMGAHGLIVHRAWRRTLFLLLILTGIVSLVGYGVWGRAHLAPGASSYRLTAEILIGFSFLLVLPLAYFLVQGPKRGSLIGALLACSLTLFAGGFTATAEAVLADSLSAKPAVGLPLDWRGHDSFLDNLRQQFEHE